MKSNTFIGVTTVKQPDGTEQATEIHIFPGRAPRLGRRKSHDDAGGEWRWQADDQRERVRIAHDERRRVAVANVEWNCRERYAFDPVVQYAGGSQNVAVPPNTRVTEIKRVARPIVSGENVVVFARKQSDGSLLASRVLIASK